MRLSSCEAGIIALPVRSPCREAKEVPFRSSTTRSVCDATAAIYMSSAWYHARPLHPVPLLPRRPSSLRHFHLSSPSPTWHWSHRLYRGLILPYHFLTRRQVILTTSKHTAHQPLLQVPVPPIAVAIPPDSSVIDLQPLSSGCASGRSAPLAFFTTA